MNKKNQIMLLIHGKLDKIMNLLITVNYYLVEYQLKQSRISYRTVLQENGIWICKLVFGCKMMTIS